MNLGRVVKSITVVHPGKERLERLLEHPAVEPARELANNFLFALHVEDREPVIQTVSNAPSAGIESLLYRLVSADHRVIPISGVRDKNVGFSFSHNNPITPKLQGEIDTFKVVVEDHLPEIKNLLMEASNDHSLLGEMIHGNSDKPNELRLLGDLFYVLAAICKAEPNGKVRNALKLDINHEPEKLLYNMHWTIDNELKDMQGGCATKVGLSQAEKEQKLKAANARERNPYTDPGQA